MLLAFHPYPPGQFQYSVHEVILLTHIWGLPSSVAFSNFKTRLPSSIASSVVTSWLLLSTEHGSRCATAAILLGTPHTQYVMRSTSPRDAAWQS